jgi:hypothetical protein
MELKDICCDLEWSKKLKEKGFPQDGLYTWKNYIEIEDGQLEIINEFVIGQNDHIKSNNNFWSYSAPTAEEIELPKRLYFKDRPDEPSIYVLRQDHNSVWYENYNYDILDEIVLKSKKECNRKAKMYCYLADNNLLEVKHEKRS